MIFAGLTVMISLLGLFIMGLSFVRGLAIAGATGVFVMMIASITLLPALLGFTRERIDTTSRAAAVAVGLFVVFGLAGVITDNVPALLGGGIVLALLIVAVSYLPFARAPARAVAAPPREAA